MNSVGFGQIPLTESEMKIRKDTYFRYCVRRFVSIRVTYDMTLQ